MAGYTRRRDIERDQLMLGAWMTAALTRAKKMPTLDKLLNRQGTTAPAAQQDADKMLAAMRQWASLQNGAVLAEQGQADDVAGVTDVQ